MLFSLVTIFVFLPRFLSDTKGFFFEISPRVKCPPHPGRFWICHFLSCQSVWSFSHTHFSLYAGRPLWLTQPPVIELDQTSLLLAGNLKLTKKYQKFWNSFFLNKICRVLVWTFERVKWGQSCNRLSRREWNFFPAIFSFRDFLSKFKPGYSCRNNFRHDFYSFF